MLLCPFYFTLFVMQLVSSASLCQAVIVFLYPLQLYTVTFYHFFLLSYLSIVNINLNISFVSLSNDVSAAPSIFFSSCYGIINTFILVWKNINTFIITRSDTLSCFLCFHSVLSILFPSFSPNTHTLSWLYS